MPTPHYQNSEIKIFKIIAGPYDNNAYLLVCKKTNHSILIDAPAEPNEIIKLVNPWATPYISDILCNNKNNSERFEIEKNYF